MTFNDLDKYKMVQLRLYAYQTKARNPGNTVAATNPVLDILIISIDLFKDLQIRNVFTKALCISHES